MSSLPRARRVALALAVTATLGTPASAGAMPAGPDAPAGSPSGDPGLSAARTMDRSGIVPRTDTGDATLTIVLLSGGILAAVAGGAAAYGHRRPRALPLG